MDTLVDWLTRAGTRCSRYGVRRDSSGDRSAFARESIRSGDVVLSIPFGALIACPRARNSDIGKRIARSGVDLRSEQSYLAAFLLQEMLNPSSSYRPYLDTLPLAFPHVPLFFGEDELAELKGSMTRFLIQHRRASLAEEYRNLCESVEGFSRFTPQQFVWARVAVITRTFGFAMDGRDTEGLVPLADMLNHHPTRETRWSYDGKRKCFNVVAMRDFERGDAIHGHYGHKCNSRLFVNYGFALEDNEHNEAEFVVSIVPSDPLRSAKLSLLGIPGGMRRFQLPGEFRGKAFDDLRSFLRIAGSSQEELSRVSPELAAGAKVPFLGPATELRALALLSEALTSAISAFDTSAAQDDARLNDPALPVNVRTCIIVRRGEKRVLEKLAQLCGSARAIMALAAEQRESAAREHPELAEYLRQAFAPEDAAERDAPRRP